MNVRPLILKTYGDHASMNVLLVADGLGGLALEPGGRTELETARTPHLDALARQGACRLTVPVAPGVTPGRGVGLFALLGYDPSLFRTGPADETPETAVIDPFAKVYGFRAALLTADPACRGVAGRLGVDVVEAPVSLPSSRLSRKVTATTTCWCCTTRTRTPRAPPSTSTAR